MESLEFQDGERTFTCTASSSPATPGTLWWWVSVTGELQRWAAFRTQPDDTPANLEPRVAAYYAQVLVDRARPRNVGSWAQRRAKPAEASGPAPATPAS